MTNNGAQPLAEVIDIQLALYNYDWHYNLIEIKEILEKVELMNYSKYLIEKVNVTDKLSAGLTKIGDLKITGERGQKLAEKATNAVQYIDQKKVDTMNNQIDRWG